MKKKIAFLAPSKLKLEQIKDFLQEYHNEITFAIGSLEDGIIKAKELIDKGVEIIIARGETAFNIRDAYPEIVVIDVPISGFDLVVTLEQARKFGKNIAVISFPSMIKQIECLEAALSVRIMKYNLTSRDDVNVAIDNALRDGADVLLGGYTTVTAARLRGIPCVGIITGKQAYLETFLRARDFLSTIAIEKRKSGMIQTVLDHSYEGIVSIDEKGFITTINPVARKILGFTAQTQQKIADIWPELQLDKVLAGGKEELNQLYTINNIQVLCNKVPIKDRKGIIGAVATFQDVTKIQLMESRIRKEIYSKGHIASYTFADVQTYDQKIKAAIEMAKSFAASDASVLINGETGTGKEVFAQSIHNHSKRAKGPFVAINCAALPAQLLESELFGYVGGAFTGANKEGKPGLFEVAHTGTIFLDEIGEMDYINQGRLLRVLQERVVVRLGSDKVVPVSVRVIAATNKKLPDLIADGKFREDLYYRLNVLNLIIPPLRKRRKDIIPYVKTFLAEMSREAGKSITLSQGALKVLEEYDWPGNVRELKNVIERLTVIAKRGKISAAFISQIIKPENDLAEQEFESEEATIIKQALAACNGNIAETASLLHMNRTTLWRKMNKFNIKK